MGPVKKSINWITIALWTRSSIFDSCRVTSDTDCRVVKDMAHEVHSSGPLPFKKNFSASLLLARSCFLLCCLLRSTERIVHSQIDKLFPA